MLISDTKRVSYRAVCRYAIVVYTGSSESMTLALILRKSWLQRQFCSGVAIIFIRMCRINKHILPLCI